MSGIVIICKKHSGTKDGPVILEHSFRGL